MSALRAHSSEITEGIGSSRVVSGEPEDARVLVEVSSTAVAHLDAQGVRGAGTKGNPLESGRDEPRDVAVQQIDLESVLPKSALPLSVLPHSVSGVAERGVASAANAAPRGSAARTQSGEQSRPSNTRAQSFHRYLSAQSDIDEEVIRLYKLVCRV
jgi:hypothetical protein